MVLSLCRFVGYSSGEQETTHDLERMLVCTGRCIGRWTFAPAYPLLPRLPLRSPRIPPPTLGTLFEVGSAQTNEPLQNAESRLRLSVIFGKLISNRRQFFNYRILPDQWVFANSVLHMKNQPLTSTPRPICGCLFGGDQGEGPACGPTLRASWTLHVCLQNNC